MKIHVEAGAQTDGFLFILTLGWVFMCLQHKMLSVWVAALTQRGWDSSGKPLPSVHLRDIISIHVNEIWAAHLTDGATLMI